MPTKHKLQQMPLVWLAAQCAKLADSATDDPTEETARQLTGEWAELVIRQMPDYKVTKLLEDEEAALRERMIELLSHAM